jgi:hypothetical protein
MFGIYFLQCGFPFPTHQTDITNMVRKVMDKQTISFASVFGISRDAGLAGEDYSLLGSIL